MISGETDPCLSMELDQIQPDFTFLLIVGFDSGLRRYPYDFPFFVVLYIYIHAWMHIPFSLCIHPYTHMPFSWAIYIYISLSLLDFE